MAYPFYEQLQQLSANMPNGNFGLWYNKFIPVSNFDVCKASDERGDVNNPVGFYDAQYKKIQKDAINGFLLAKHRDQAGFCQSLSANYEPIVFKARLKTPLITGIGESHPHEVSLVFDHNLGVPYIPASGIKGIVRFAHTLGLIESLPGEKIKTDDKGNSYFNDEEDWTGVPRLFGTQSSRGNVFFLDAYPEKMPSLHVDIMNPHYGKYYSEDTTPPGDYLDPNPIKFLTVAKGATFVFRALVAKEYPDLIKMVNNAFDKVLTEEGVGAKTAVGYGLFDIVETSGNKKPSPSTGRDAQIETLESEVSATTTTTQEISHSEPVIENWESVTLVWRPNDQTITAARGNKKAFAIGKEIVPEKYHKKLFVKPKSITATIDVEPIGNGFRILKIY